jgi:site-specific recombinase XerD
MAKRHLKLVMPATVNRTVAPRRPPNAELRTREYLTEREVERLMKAARGNRWGHRDATMLLVAYRHGLRASELVDLRLGSDRVQNGLPACPQGQAGHPEYSSDPRGRATRAAAAQAGAGAKKPLCVHLGAGAPFTSAGFARMVERAGREAKLAFKAHPHMLRHACGYALANKGHDTRALQAYLGHRNIQHTVRYTELSPTRFKDFWRK